MNPSYRPWHKVTLLRDDIKTGENSLSEFAADLYDVVMQNGQSSAYEDPYNFFSLTYPTENLRKLVKDVALRLAGKSTKAYRQLSVNYGGGKTHTLIALRHLAHDPDKLPDLPAVRDFNEDIGFKLPRARVAALCFDKIDEEKGLKTLSPDGAVRNLKYPWSILAFQLAGAEGLSLIHADGKAEERDTPPADPLLQDLLSMPLKEKLSTLVLLDETLMYVQSKVEREPEWRGRLRSFFQYLTQAVVKTNRCAMVTSLLASDPGKHNELGKELLREISSVFGRQNEEDAIPVGKDDVVEVLLRRFFKLESIEKRSSFRPYVIAAVKGIAALDGETKKERSKKEKEYLESYPFHPALIEILYTRWTQLERFQRTRGILRTFALALRDAERWDQGPLIGTNVFLAEPGKSDLAEATSELTDYASVPTETGNERQWRPIIREELEKARMVQLEMPKFALHREIEKAVIAVFLCSQPSVHKASTQELLVLLGATAPDKIELEKALLRWTELSWFLDEKEVATGGISSSETRQLPRAWRLGNSPNLHQMHHYACKDSVSPSLVEIQLINHIQQQKSFTTCAPGVKVHNLPERPSDISDDGQFHYGVLGPKAASESGKPSAKAIQLIEEGSSTDYPRVHRNPIVFAVPSKEALEVAQQRIREYLGWIEVREQLKGQPNEPGREQILSEKMKRAKEGISEAIKQAYSVVVTVNAKNKIHAFKISVENESLFTLIKNDPRSRIQETAINPDAMMPDGPYDLWKKGEQSRRVKHLVDAFSQNPKLPKMLHSQGILDTVAKGIEKGIWVAQVKRPDHTSRTFWRTTIDEADLKDPELEVLLPQAATLSELSPNLLAYQKLPELWPTEEISIQDIYDYFANSRTVSQPSGDGYEEEQVIPKCEPATVEAAIEKAVEQGLVWLTNEPASILGEPVPQGILNASASLRKPPEDIPVDELMPSSIPSAWEEGKTSALAIVAALSSKRGITLPWPTVKKAIMAGIHIRWLELTDGNTPWPCDLASAQKVILQKPSGVKEDKGKKTTGPLTAETFLEIDNIQDLADQIPDITKKAAGNNIKFKIYIELGDGKTTPDNKTVEELNQLLSKVSDNLRLR